MRRTDGPALLERHDPPYRSRQRARASPANPFGTSSDPIKKRVLAYGLRNPFRFTTRPGTNELWVGDVGWNTWEEINRVADTTAGAAHELRWPCYEGNPIQPGYQSAGLTMCNSLYSNPSQVTAPFFSYNHCNQVIPGETCPTGGSSVTGLAFYGGGSYPASYNGGLFFADYSRNCIWFMPAGANGTARPAVQTFEPGAGLRSTSRSARAATSSTPTPKAAPSIASATPRPLTSRRRR